MALQKGRLRGRGRLDPLTPWEPSGFNVFLNGIDVTPDVFGEWRDVDVSDHIPANSTGVILNLHRYTGTEYRDVRMKGSTDDDYSESELTGFKGASIIGVDENRVFQAKITSNVKIFLVGYCDENVVFFENKIDVTSATKNAWTDTDVSAHVSSDATGVILKVVNSHGISAGYENVRNNGSSDNRKPRIYPHCLRYRVIGIDENKIFEQYVGGGTINVSLVGYTKPPIQFFTNGKDISLEETDEWVDIDVTSISNSGASTAIIEVMATYAANRSILRKKGSTDDRFAQSHFFEEGQCNIIGLDRLNRCQGKVNGLNIDYYLLGYCSEA